MHRFFLLALLIPSTALAVPMEVSHQGRLMDSSGVPLDGAQDVTVKLWDDATAGTELWTDDYTAHPFSDGYYSMQLGSGAALDSTVVAGDDLYLELTVNGSVLGSRLQVVSVPFAMRADSAGSVEGGVVNASEVQIGGTTVIDSSGMIDSSALPTDSDTLAALGCSSGDVAAFDGTDWQCAPANPAHTHDASQIDAGTLDILRLPIGNSANDVAAGDHVHAMSSLTGQADITQLPVGTTSSDVAAGDHAHAVDYTDLSGSWQQGMVLHYDSTDAASYDPSAPAVWNDLSSNRVPADVGTSNTYATVDGVDTLVFAGDANSYAMFDNRAVLDPRVMTGVMWVYNQNPDGGDFGGLYINRDDTAANDPNWVWFGEWGSDRWYFRIGRSGACCDQDLTQLGFSTNIAPNDEWHMVHFAYIVGGEQKVGSDGVTVARKNLGDRPTPFGQVESTSTIGYGHTGTGGHWQGAIAEVMFWDRVLSDAELTNLFDATKGKYGL